jgi:hypothetical protein
MDKEWDSSLCDGCEVNKGTELHECPYDQEIGKGNVLCNCCEDCIEACKDDI